VTLPKLTERQMGSCDGSLTAARSGRGRMRRTSTPPGRCRAGVLPKSAASARYGRPLSPAGRYYLEHGAYEPRRVFEADRFVGERPSGRTRQTDPGPGDPPLDATASAMRLIAHRPKPTELKQTRREIKETYMRYKVVVTRVQVAERFVRAPQPARRPGPRTRIPPRVIKGLEEVAVEALCLGHAG
jgi:hypothetical protein